ncbi:hypothetical protein GCM10009422_00670 [Brevundimonas kwangchunensis]|uniref:Uncharacterized protein n=1 Tax=Brevundimonas kwangchunensis TaxID=322163 RepID=A0ABP3RL32_9CAUL
MTSTARKFSNSHDAGRYTRLETAVMSALAQDLRGQVPDIAAQFSRSKATIRRNSGFGQFTEMLIDAHRPAPGGPTGDLGTVHVVITGLRHPVAFRARVRDGRLLGLLADSYGEDTRAIDFATVPFDQIFTIEASGAPVHFAGTHRPETAANQAKSRTEARQEASRPQPVRQAPTQSVPTSAPPPRVQARTQSVSVPVTRQTPPTPRQPQPAAVQPDPDVITDEDITTMRIGLWAMIGVIGMLLFVVFGVPLPFVLVGGFIIGRYFQTEKGLIALRRIQQSLKSAQDAAQSRQTG